MSERSARKGVQRVRRTPPGTSTTGNRPPGRAVDKPSAWRIRPSARSQPWSR